MGLMGGILLNEKKSNFRKKIIEVGFESILDKLCYPLDNKI